MFKSVRRLCILDGRTWLWPPFVTKTTRNSVLTDLAHTQNFGRRSLIISCSGRSSLTPGPAVGFGGSTITVKRMLSSRVINGVKQKILAVSSGHNFARHNSESNAINSKDVGNTSDVIYIGTLARMVRFVKLFSLSTSVIGVALQPVIYQHVADLPIYIAAAVGGMASFFIFITPVLLHFVTKRYVTRITLDKTTNEFTATTYSLLLQEKFHRFTPEQVSVPNVPGLFTTIRVGGNVPLFIDPNLFTDQQYFVQIMKYDEPLEWEIDDEEKEDEIREDKSHSKSNSRPSSKS